MGRREEWGKEYPKDVASCYWDTSQQNVHFHISPRAVCGGVLNIIHAHSALFFSALLTNRAYYCWMFEGCVHWQVQQ